MSLFLIFLLALPFVLSADDWAKGITIVIIGLIILAIAFVAVKIASSQFVSDLCGLIKNLIELYL